MIGRDAGVAEKVNGGGSSERQISWDYSPSSDDTGNESPSSYSSYKTSEEEGEYVALEDFEEEKAHGSMILLPESDSTLSFGMSNFAAGDVSPPVPSFQTETDTVRSEKPQKLDSASRGKLSSKTSEARCNLVVREDADLCCLLDKAILMRAVSAGHTLYDIKTRKPLVVRSVEEIKQEVKYTTCWGTVLKRDAATGIVVLASGRKGGTKVLMRPRDFVASGGEGLLVFAPGGPSILDNRKESAEKVMETLTGSTWAEGILLWYEDTLKAAQCKGVVKPLLAFSLDPLKTGTTYSALSVEGWRLVTICKQSPCEFIINDKNYSPAKVKEKMLFPASLEYSTPQFDIDLSEEIDKLLEATKEERTIASLTAYASERARLRKMRFFRLLRIGIALKKQPPKDVSDKINETVKRRSSNLKSKILNKEELQDLVGMLAIDSGGDLRSSRKSLSLHSTRIDDYIVDRLNRRLNNSQNEKTKQSNKKEEGGEKNKGDDEWETVERPTCPAGRFCPVVEPEHFIEYNHTARTLDDLLNQVAIRLRKEDQFASMLKQKARQQALRKQPSSASALPGRAAFQRVQEARRGVGADETISKSGGETEAASSPHSLPPGSASASVSPGLLPSFSSSSVATTAHKKTSTGEKANVGVECEHTTSTQVRLSKVKANSSAPAGGNKVGRMTKEKRERIANAAAAAQNKKKRAVKICPSGPYCSEDDPKHFVEYFHAVKLTPDDKSASEGLDEVHFTIRKNKLRKDGKPHKKAWTTKEGRKKQYPHSAEEQKVKVSRSNNSRTAEDGSRVQSSRAPLEMAKGKQEKYGNGRSTKGNSSGGDNAIKEDVDTALGVMEAKRSPLAQGKLVQFAPYSVGAKSLAAYFTTLIRESEETVRAEEAIPEGEDIQKAHSVFVQRKQKRSKQDHPRMVAVGRARMSGTSAGENNSNKKNDTEDREEKSQERSKQEKSNSHLKRREKKSRQSPPPVPSKATKPSKKTTNSNDDRNGTKAAVPFTLAISPKKQRPAVDPKSFFNSPSVTIGAKPSPPPRSDVDKKSGRVVGKAHTVKIKKKQRACAATAVGNDSRPKVHSKAGKLHEEGYAPTRQKRNAVNLSEKKQSYTKNNTRATAVTVEHVSKQVEKSKLELFNAMEGVLGQTRTLLEEIESPLRPLQKEGQEEYKDD